MGVTGQFPAGSRVQTFARAAGIVFALYAVYPLITKIAGGRLAGDWVHTALHFLSSGAAAFAGWRAREPRAARIYALVIAASYLSLGAVGWFIEGIALGTPLAIPLGPADNIFHLLMGAAALAALNHQPTTSRT